MSAATGGGYEGSLIPFTDEAFRESFCKDDGVRPAIKLLDTRGLLTYKLFGVRRVRWLVALAIQWRLRSWKVPDPADHENATVDVTDVDVSVNGLDLDVSVAFEGQSSRLECGLTVEIVDDCDELAGPPIDVDERKRDVEQVNDVPCYARRSRQTCMSTNGVDGTCSVPGQLLEGCDCLWDYPGTDGALELDSPCPEGEVCCFNMPCDRWDDDELSFITDDPIEHERMCQEGGGSSSGVPAPGVPAEVIGNCMYVPENAQSAASSCQCRGLLQATYAYNDIRTLSSLFNNTGATPFDGGVPFDCFCPFFESPAAWFLATNLTGLNGAGEAGLCQTPPNNEGGVSQIIINSFVEQVADFIEATNRQTYLRQCKFVHVKIYKRLGGALLQVARNFIKSLKHHGVSARIVSMSDRFCTILTPANHAAVANRMAQTIDTELYAVEQVVDTQAAIDGVDVADAKQAPAAALLLSAAVAALALAVASL